MSEIHLTASERVLYEAIRAGAGETLTYEALTEVLGYCCNDGFPELDAQTVRAHISNLRAKVADGDHIHCERGWGYYYAAQPKELTRGYRLIGRSLLSLPSTARARAMREERWRRRDRRYGITERTRQEAWRGAVSWVESQRGRAS